MSEPKLKMDFGPDLKGGSQVFEVPAREELLLYLKAHLFGLRRNPNACPYVSLHMPAMHVYALLDALDLQDEETEIGE